MGLRILHVATRHRVGGAERNLLHTASRELERGFDVHVAVGTSELHTDFPDRTCVHPLPELVRDVSPRADRCALEKLRALIRTGRFDVVHTHQSKAGALGRAAARGLAPVVLHTVHMSSFGPAYGRARSAVFLALERWLAGFTDKLVFVGSDLQRRYLDAGVGSAERSAIVRSPIADLESLFALRTATAHDHARARVPLGVAGAARMVLMVAALDRRHDLPIRALAPLLADGNTVLIIAGEGPERPALEALCSALGVGRAVRFLGVVADVRPLFAAADLFLHTSTIEGVAQTVVQPVAAGVPVIATEVDGVREVAQGSRQVVVLPPDGRELRERVSSALGTCAPAPAAPESVRAWLPAAVDRELAALHDWMEARLREPRAPIMPSPVRTPLAPARASEEPVLP